MVSRGMKTVIKILNENREKEIKKRVEDTRFIKILVLVALKALLKIRTIYIFLIHQKAQI